MKTRDRNQNLRYRTHTTEKRVPGSESDEIGARRWDRRGMVDSGVVTSRSRVVLCTTDERETLDSLFARAV
jgi:hypothetical protein